jgi:hypothetical protein
MNRRRESGAELMMLAASKLPWWLCLVLGALSDFVLTYVASLPLPKPQGHLEDIQTATRSGFVYAFASMGRIALPLIFAIGAVLSALQRSRKANAAPAQQDCPVCGKAMVSRTAQRGPNAGEKFWGCSDFPKCRGTRKA